MSHIPVLFPKEVSHQYLARLPSTKWEQKSPLHGPDIILGGKPIS